MARHQITVVGASNIDLNATAFATLVAADSNPGIVKTSVGGVGRNIAENLARIGQQVRLLTAYGDDSFAATLQDHAKSLNMDVSESLLATGVASSLYLCVNQPEGEMSVAIADMAVCDLVTPAFVKEKLPLLNQSEAVVIDTNFPGETLSFIAENCAAPIFAETVSTKKGKKLRPLLSRLTGITTNRSEVEMLTGVSVSSIQDAHLAAAALQQVGIPYVFLTMGSQGALACCEGKTTFLPPFPHALVNTTGCGDAFFAGAIYAFLEGADPEGILRHGLGMAALCAEAEAAVSPDISLRRLADIIHQYKEVVSHESF